MTKILWLSRHALTDEQLADLRRIYGQIEVYQHNQTVKSAQEVVSIATEHGCDILAVVLPPNILSELTNPRVNTKPVIRAKANRIPTGQTTVNPANGKEEQEFMFQHAGWERVVRIEIVTEDL